MSGAIGNLDSFLQLRFQALLQWPVQGNQSLDDGEGGAGLGGKQVDDRPVRVRNGKRGSIPDIGVMGGQAPAGLGKQQVDSLLDPPQELRSRLEPLGDCKREKQVPSLEIGLFIGNPVSRLGKGGIALQIKFRVAGFQIPVGKRDRLLRLERVDGNPGQRFTIHPPALPCSGRTRAGSSPRVA